MIETAADEIRTADMKIRECGYTLMCDDGARLDYNKGYTEDGFAPRVFHLHLRVNGDCDELFFRDYLNRHSDVAKEYEKLKLSLWKKYEHDRDGYTGAKGDFIRKWTETAKKEAQSGMREVNK